MSDSLTRISKFLSYVLRHNPAALNLDLEPGGWVDIDVLIERARTQNRNLSRTRIKTIIDGGTKTRFAVSTDGTKIRANYGHSIEVDLGLEPTAPPDELYHGTAHSAVPSIRNEGLHPQSRQYVHLSSTLDEASAVGRRHGSPVVLPIDAPALHDAGYTCYRSTDAVWLTDRVPPSFIQFPTP